MSTGAVGAGTGVAPPRSPKADREREELLRWGRDHLWMQGRTAADLQGTGEYRIMVRGDGCHLVDGDGRRYIDGTSSSYVRAMGHGRPEIRRAIAAQLDALAFAPLSFGHVTEVGIRLARKIAALAPGSLNRTFFCGGGGEAVEIATKMARQYQSLAGHPGRRKIISFRPEYHGSLYMAMALGQRASRNHDLFEPLPGGVVQVDAPACFRCPWGLGDSGDACCMLSVRQLARTIASEGPDQIAAVVATPFRAGGPHPPPGHLLAVRRICDEHGILLIADEVTMGFGRLGSWFGMERFDVVPDIMAVGKAMTSGELPVGAVVARSEIAELFDTLSGGRGQFQHGVTFGAHPAVMAAGLANLELMEREDVVGNARRLESPFHALVLDLQARHRIVGATYGGLGLMETLALVKDPASRRGFRKSKDAHFFARLTELVSAGGLSLRVGPSIVLAPPLVATRALVEEMIGILDDALTTVQREIPVGP